MSFRIDRGVVAASHTTDEGWQRLYIRLAKADHDYRYFNSDGTERIERCAADELFRADSAATAKMVPIGIGHPACVKVNHDNVAGWLTGSTGHTVIREQTPDGEFLGITATIFDRKTQNALAQTPGISPGYSTKIARTDMAGTRFDQTNREYNHVAAAVIPRGGNDVRAMFEGLRIDSLDDSDLWIARLDDSVYLPDVNHDQVDPVLTRLDEIPDLVERKPVDLSMAKLSKEEAPDDDRDDQKSSKKKSSAKADASNCEECGKKNCDCSKNAKSKASGTRGVGFGGSNQRPRTRKDMVDMQIGNVTYPDVPDNLATAINGLIDAVDRADAASSTHEQYKTDAQARIQELEEELEEAEARADGEPAGYSDEQALQIATNLAGVVDRIRLDGQLLVDMGVVKAFNTDFAYIVENMEGLQSEMLTLASPRMADRIDSMDPEQIEIAYETAMASTRDFYESQQRNDAQEDEAEDRQDMKLNHRSPMSRKSGSPKSPKLMTGGRMTLSKVGASVKPMDAKAGAKSVYARYTEMDDKIFDDATSAVQGRAFTHPMTAKMM